jgi:outer membrane protein assembly factor BamB
MVQVNGSSAKQLWMNRTMQAHFNSPFYYGGCIFGTGDPGNLVCLDPKTGRQLWVKQDFEKGGLVGVDGTLIVLNGRSGEVTQAALTSKGYQELGKMRGLGGQSWTAPIVANGKLYIRNKSTLACYALK